MICRGTGEFYVGASSNVEVRWRGHTYYPVNKKVYQSWQTHGKQSFRFELLEECLPEHLVERENFWLQELQPTLNTSLKARESSYWKKKMNIKTSSIFNDGIDLAARLCGFPRGSGGNAKAMLEAIAKGDLFPIPLDQKGFDKALECDRLIRLKQSFFLAYKDSQGIERRFSVRFAEIAFHEKRFYLDCWAVETDENQDLPELRHNWCLRFDRILHLEPEPSAPWINSLDSTLVQFRLFNGLIKAYERKPSDMQVQLEGEGERLLVDRAITNSFWFVRSILPYGADCEVLSPQPLRQQLAEQFLQSAQRYGGLGSTPAPQR